MLSMAVHVVTHVSLPQAWQSTAGPRHPSSHANTDEVAQQGVFSESPGGGTPKGAAAEETTTGCRANV